MNQQKRFGKGAKNELGFVAMQWLPTHFNELQNEFLESKHMMDNAF